MDVKIAGNGRLLHRIQSVPDGELFKNWPMRGYSLDSATGGIPSIWIRERKVVREIPKRSLAWT